ncbi:MAG: Nif3-like dinuclear metal center hexameric protein [Pseudomonadota bacterium]|nr:Nif3-like dinuclear metal center hexameric protein [Pseudomonadota bacterium]
MLAKTLETHVNEILASARYKDYCPNGLQVEGRANVEHIVTGVTANMELLQKAVDVHADAVLVHHGYFWKGEPGNITGMKRCRIGYLIEHDLNLFAWHLPLDAHPELGNNIQLAKRAGWIPEGQFGDQDLGWYGRIGSIMNAQDFARFLEHLLERPPLLIGDAGRRISRIAWCSGAAQSYFLQAVSLGVDAFVSGEISEQTVHIANETGVVYLAAGHHATERYGIRALGDYLSRTFGLSHTHIDVPNPV